MSNVNDQTLSGEASSQAKKGGSKTSGRRGLNLWAWIIFIIGIIYFFLPLVRHLYLA